MTTDRQQHLDLGRSLLATVLIRLVRERTQPVLIGLGIVAVAAIVGAVVFDGWLTVGLGAVAIVAAMTLVVGLVVRRAVTFGIGRLAPPADLNANQDAFDHAVEELKLPLGPISTPRFALRLRRGVDTEIDRMAGVLVDLADQLER